MYSQLHNEFGPPPFYIVWCHDGPLYRLAKYQHDRSEYRVLQTTAGGALLHTHHCFFNLTLFCRVVAIAPSDAGRLNPLSSGWCCVGS